MSSKKISDLPQSLGSRDEDFLPIVTGLREGETPETQKVKRATLRMTAGGAKAYDTIMSKQPDNYWPLDAPFFNPIDEVTQTVGTNAFMAGKPIVTSLTSGAARPTILFTGVNMMLETQIEANYLEQRTVIFALQPNQGSTTHPCGTMNLAGNTGWQVISGLTTNALSCRHATPSGFISILVPGFNFSQFNVLAWTFSVDSGHRFFKNGIEVATSTNVSPTNLSASKFTIGRAQDGTSGRYNGYIQDVALWNRVISDEDILEIANAIMGV